MKIENSSRKSRLIEPSDVVFRSNADLVVSDGEGCDEVHVHLLPRPPLLRLWPTPTELVLQNRLQTLRSYLRLRGHRYAIRPRTRKVL